MLAFVCWMHNIARFRDDTFENHHTRALLLGRRGGLSLERADEQFHGTLLRQLFDP